MTTCIVQVCSHRGLVGIQRHPPSGRLIGVDGKLLEKVHKAVTDANYYASSRKFKSLSRTLFPEDLTDARIDLPGFDALLPKPTLCLCDVDRESIAYNHPGFNHFYQLPECVENPRKRRKLGPIGSRFVDFCQIRGVQHVGFFPPDVSEHLWNDVRLMRACRDPCAVADYPKQHLEYEYPARLKTGETYVLEELVVNDHVGRSGFKLCVFRFASRKKSDCTAFFRSFVREAYFKIV